MNHHHYQSNETTDSQQLHRAQHTVTTLSIELVLPSWFIIKFTGTVDFKIEYFCLTNPITLSTCMRTRDS